MPKKDKAVETTADYSEIQTGLDPSDEQGDQGDVAALSSEEATEIFARKQREISRNWPNILPAYTPPGEWEHRLHDKCPQCGMVGKVLARDKDRHCSKCHRDWTV